MPLLWGRGGYIIVRYVEVPPVCGFVEFMLKRDFSFSFFRLFAFWALFACFFSDFGSSEALRLGNWMFWVLGSVEGWIFLGGCSFVRGEGFEEELVLGIDKSCV